MTITTREPIETTNLDGYGSPPLPWSRAHEALSEASGSADVPFFLGTADRDGRPHAAGIGAIYVDGDLYFVSGPGTRKSRDLAANPACTMSTRVPTIDLVFEGVAIRITDPASLAHLAGVYSAGGWPAEAVGDAFTAPFNAPSAGPPPWHVYRLQGHTIVGVATAEPHGATRWRFSTD